MRGRLRTRRSLDENGTALIEFTWLALLLMLPMIYILIGVFEAQRGAYGVSTASRSAARAFSLAPDPGTGDARARSAARVALKDQGIDDPKPDVKTRCTGPCLQPGSVVHVTVSTKVNLPLFPDFMGGARPSFTVTSKQSVPYGTYREGQ